MRYFILYILLSFLINCAPPNLIISRNYYYKNQYEKAYKVLNKYGAKKKDRILYFYEKGMILQAAGKYEESNRNFNLADNLLEEYETLSVSKGTSSYVTGDYIKIYTGEKFEQILDNTYSAINYIKLKKYDDALIESRRALKKIDYLNKGLDEHFFTRYLSSICFLLMREKDDAYIELKKLYDKRQDFEFVNKELVELSYELGMTDEYENWKKKTGFDIEHNDEQGILYLFYNLGRGPVKVENVIVLPDGMRYSLPKYRKRFSRAKYVKVYVNDTFMDTSVLMTDVDKLAELNLNARITRAGLKEAGRILTKESLSEKIYKDMNEDIGYIAKLVLNSTEKADLRCWQTLPSTIQLNKLLLKPGIYKIKLEVYNELDDVIGEETMSNIEIKKDSMQFINYRFAK